MIKYKISFILRFKTFQSIALLDNNTIAICCSKGIFKLNRRCPHQGAFLEKSYKNDNILTCHWHGCKFLVDVIGEDISRN